MQNKYSAPCWRCGETVAAGAGLIERASKTEWRIQHPACAEKWKGTPKRPGMTRKQVKAAMEEQSDGVW